ncbi:formyltetrahydrofolate deformylase [Ascidiimonas sp. W6]|uniref:formyltetrahydrofolate deformylase n=1 Tax=Ascidiimonas meishanensis TaxID=3128903 RepID=UPI0030ECAB96
MNHLTLLIHCPDQKGIIASVTSFVQQQSGNITYIDQHVDSQHKAFFMRLECAFENPTFDKASFESNFHSSLAKKYKMYWQLFDAQNIPNMAIFVSKYDHCLFDILARYRSGELGVKIPFIISNHKDLGFIAENFEIPFFHIPVTKETKVAAEQRQLELLAAHKVDFIVLARYMQIVSGSLISHYTNRIINIHHSFLPAFPGAKPYHSAFERGVKIIGATSHYVTEELDAGPIIEQDTTQVSHVHTIKDFIAKGRDLEKIVLSRAIKLHLARKTMVYNNKTIVFT